MRTALRHEWSLLKRDRAWWMLYLAFVCVLGYGATESVTRVWARSEQVDAAVRDYDARWSQLRAQAEHPPAVWGDWRSPSLVGGPSGFAVATMPVDGRAALSVGESVRRPPVRRISIYPQEPEPPLENPLGIAGGTFDLGFVTQWILPLAILVATHGVVSGDRQLGTWRLIAATAASPARILVARLVWPTALLVASSAIAGTAAVALADPGRAIDSVGALAAWIAVTLVYAASWSLVAGMVSARMATAAQSMVVLVLLWVAAVWVVPGVIDAAVTASVPPANRLEAHLAGREAQRDLEARLPAMLEEVYAKHPEWRPSPAVVAAATTPVPGGPASRDSRRVYVPALVATEVAAPFAQMVAARRDRVERLVHRLSVLNPPLAYQFLADHFAGTSAARLALFEQHVSAAEEAWQVFFSARILQLQEMNRPDMDQVPTPRPFEASAPLTAELWPLAGLLTALGLTVLGLVQSLPALKG